MHRPTRDEEKAFNNTLREVGGTSSALREMFAAMGYHGGGLGKNADGIAAPIDASVRQRGTGLGFSSSTSRPVVPKQPPRRRYSSSSSEPAEVHNVDDDSSTTRRRRRDRRRRPAPAGSAADADVIDTVHSGSDAPSSSVPSNSDSDHAPMPRRRRRLPVDHLGGSSDDSSSASHSTRRPKRARPSRPEPAPQPAPQPPQYVFFKDAAAASAPHAGRRRGASDDDDMAGPELVDVLQSSSSDTARGAAPLRGGLRVSRSANVASADAQHTARSTRDDHAPSAGTGGGGVTGLMAVARSVAPYRRAGALGLGIGRRRAHPAAGLGVEADAAAAPPSREVVDVDGDGDGDDEGLAGARGEDGADGAVVADAASAAAAAADAGDARFGLGLSAAFGVRRRRTRLAAQPDADADAPTSAAIGAREGDANAAGDVGGVGGVDGVGLSDGAAGVDGADAPLSTRGDAAGDGAAVPHVVALEQRGPPGLAAAAPAGAAADEPATAPATAPATVQVDTAAAADPPTDDFDRDALAALARLRARRRRARADHHHGCEDAPDASASPAAGHGPLATGEGAPSGGGDGGSTAPLPSTAAPAAHTLAGEPAPAAPSGSSSAAAVDDVPGGYGSQAVPGHLVWPLWRGEWDAEEACVVVPPITSTGAAAAAGAARRSVDACVAACAVLYITSPSTAVANLAVDTAESAVGALAELSAASPVSTGARHLAAAATSVYVALAAAVRLCADAAMGPEAASGSAADTHAAVPPNTPPPALSPEALACMSRLAAVWRSFVMIPEGRAAAAAAAKAAAAAASAPPSDAAADVAVSVAQCVAFASPTRAAAALRAVCPPEARARARVAPRRGIDEDAIAPTAGASTAAVPTPHRDAHSGGSGHAMDDDGACGRGATGPAQAAGGGAADADGSADPDSARGTGCTSVTDATARLRRVLRVHTNNNAEAVGEDSRDVSDAVRAYITGALRAVCLPSVAAAAAVRVLRAAASPPLSRAAAADPVPPLASPREPHVEPAAQHDDGPFGSAVQRTMAAVLGWICPSVVVPPPPRPYCGRAGARSASALAAAVAQRAPLFAPPGGAARALASAVGVRLAQTPMLVVVPSHPPTEDLGANYVRCFKEWVLPLLHAPWLPSAPTVGGAAARVATAGSADPVCPRAASQHPPLTPFDGAAAAYIVAVCGLGRIVSAAGQIAASRVSAVASEVLVHTTGSAASGAAVPAAIAAAVASAATAGSGASSAASAAVPAATAAAACGIAAAKLIRLLPPHIATAPAVVAECAVACATIVAVAARCAPRAEPWAGVVRIGEWTVDHSRGGRDDAPGQPPSGVPEQVRSRSPSAEPLVYAEPQQPHRESNTTTMNDDNNEVVHASAPIPVGLVGDNAFDL